MEKQIHNFALLVYKAGYEEGQAEWHSIEDEEREMNYKRGLDDAWEHIEKLGQLTIGEIYEIFGVNYDNIYGIIADYTPSEFIKAIKEYEEKQTNDEVKQWDEICGNSDPQNKSIVISIGAWGDWNCVDKEGRTFTLNDEYKKHWKKTGKSYPELANVLEQLKGDKE